MPGSRLHFNPSKLYDPTRRIGGRGTGGPGGNPLPPWIPPAEVVYERDFEAMSLQDPYVDPDPDFTPYNSVWAIAQPSGTGTKRLILKEFHKNDRNHDRGGVENPALWTDGLKENQPLKITSTISIRPPAGSNNSGYHYVPITAPADGSAAHGLCLRVWYWGSFDRVQLSIVSGWNTLASVIIGSIPGTFPDGDAIVEIQATISTSNLIEADIIIPELDRDGSVSAEYSGTGLESSERGFSAFTTNDGAPGEPGGILNIKVEKL